MATGASLTTQAPQLSGTRLTPGKDFTTLYFILSKHATKWRSIGLHLGFLPNELDLIQGKSPLLTEAVSGSLEKMLAEWLQWAPGDGRGSKGYATVEDLHSALCRARLGVTASELAKTFGIAMSVTSTQSATTSESFQTTSDTHIRTDILHSPAIDVPQVSSRAQLQHGDQEYRIHPSQGYTSADQRSSREPLNQFQNTGPHTVGRRTNSFPPLRTVNPRSQHPRVAQRDSSSPQLINFPQRVEPHTHLETFHYSDRPNPQMSSSYPCQNHHHFFMPSNDIWGGSYHPSEVVGSHTPPQVSHLPLGQSPVAQAVEYDEHYIPRVVSAPTLSLDPTPAITRYADYLRGVYYNSAKVCSDKFPYISGEKYISLALVEKEEISQIEAVEFTKATLHGDIDKILKKKKPIEMEDILTEEQPHMKCVFVEGAPGVGKSTFCGEFCRRWDEIEALKKFKLVYLLRLREKRVQEAQSLKDLFYHDDSDLCDSVFREILKSEGRGVLLVLDGFDELPVSLQKSSLFVRLIQGSCLPYCTVLVTSRPSATADLLKVAESQINKQVELLGFTQERIEEYTRSTLGSQALSDDFLTYISLNPAIRSMMYIPLNCAIVVKVYKAKKTTGSPIPQTMTQLYSELSHVLLKRHLLDRGDPLAEDLPGLEHIKPQHKLYKPLCELAKFAFEGIERQEVIFDKLPDGCDHFGFMNASSELYLGRKGRVSFLHMTLQEFLAAFHISQLPADKQRLLFEKYHNNKNFEVVWRFVAGLTGFKGIKCAWKEFENAASTETRRNVGPFYIRCLYEAQKKVDYDSVCPKSKVVSYESGYRMQLFDYYALGYCVSATKCKWKLIIRLNAQEFDSGELEMLSYELRDKEENSYKLRSKVENIISLITVDNDGHFNEQSPSLLRKS